ncbi:hypothetical protein FRB94_008257 [Tulasnella sp. JGI-2019a]|nr:hypothetical protein FRB94_008257 [Tulasnella sp. JGI-2019a]
MESVDRHVKIEVIEVIDKIIDFLPTNDRAKAALVCRQWCDIVLPKIWRAVDLHSLLSLLVPLVSWITGDGKLMFETSLINANWERFHSRARLVRALSWDDDNDDNTLDNDVFAQILLHRPQVGPLLPVITKLTWKANNDTTALQLLPMASTSLKTLRLNIQGGCESSSLINVLRGVSARGVKLSELRIETCHGVNEFENELADIIADQQSLRSVGLPHYYGAARIVAALGSLPSLEEVSLTNWLWGGAGRNEWTFGVGAFLKLRAFSWNQEILGQGVELLRSNIPPNLINISLTTSGPTDSIGLTAFVLLLATAIPRLESLSLCHFIDTNDFGDAKTFEALEPLFACKDLRRLHISDNEPMVLWEGDVIKMANAWPSLCWLHLTPDPIDEITEEVGATIAILSVFGQSFARLEHLGLYFRAVDSKSLDSSIFTLPTLHTLSVGTSPAADINKSSYAAFLAGACPLGITIEAGRSSLSSPYTEDRENDREDERANAERVWSEIGERIRGIHRFQTPLRYQLEMAKLGINGRA